MDRIKLDRGPSDIVMIANCIPIPSSSDDVERALCGDVNGIFPSWIQVIVDNACFRDPLLMLVRQDDIGIAASVHVAGFEIFRLHNLDREHIRGRPAHLQSLRGRMLRDNFCATIDIDFPFKFVQLRKCILDVVQFDQRLIIPSATS